MKKSNMIGVLIALSLTCLAHANPASAPSSNANTVENIYNKAVGKAKSALESVLEVEKPRQVNRAAKPEIIIKDSQLFYNGKELVLGASLAEWQKILGKHSRTGQDRPAILYIWDELGLQVLTGQPAEELGKVEQIKIYLLKNPIYEGMYRETHSPDGKPLPPYVDRAPKKTFSGYLELDGFGIDAKTEFRELRAAAKPSRKLKCGNLDCSTPSGGLGGNSGVITLHLNRRSDRGNINEFVIGQ